MTKKLYSQQMREIAVEMDSLKLGMGWKYEDLSKPQIIIESSQGDSHPGSSNLNELVELCDKTLYKAGARGAKITTTDMCDGIAQGHDGMNYSLVSREMIANMIEIQAKSTPYDGAIFISSCDKSVPAHLKAIARLNMPSIMVPGGVMLAGKNNLTLEQIGTYNAKFKRNEITKEKFVKYQKSACPGCGACSFMGTAATMQIMAESFGIALPGSALIPTTIPEYKEFTKKASKQILNLVKSNLLPQEIMTKKAFENAIMVHAAIAGSSNSLLHLPAIAYELNIDINAAMFDEIHRKIPYITNIRPSGKFPAEYFWYAGGVPEVMRQIKQYLNLDVLTVTGETLGDNLENLEKSKYFKSCNKYLKKKKISKEKIILNSDNPISSQGAIAILKGNLATEGAVIKHSAVDQKMKKVTLKAKIFNSEEDAFKAVIEKKIKPGDAVVIRYEGPKATGMPELYYTTEAIASDAELVSTVALITDGRFSGATRGPAIGHVSPEAIDNGAIALIEDNDLILIDIEERKIEIIGVNNQEQDKEQIDKILQERKENFVPPVFKKKRGVLAIYEKLAVSAIKGGYIE